MCLLADDCRPGVRAGIHFRPKTEEVNQQGCLLQKEREELLGASVHGIFASEELSAATRSDTKLSTCVVSVNGTDFVVAMVISPPYLEANSIVLLFQRVEHILQKENSVRLKLRENGFIANYTFSGIIHASAAMQQTITKARQYANAACSSIIQGETETGKELFAQSIHNASPLAKGPFVAVNCGAIPMDMLESELFGYAPGAFTGAMRSGKAGLFELSHGGTLFLDEITEMDFFLQTRLRRVLQAKEVMRIGDNKVIPVTVRVIAATNRTPPEEVAAGRLRADLFYRLNVLELKVPPCAKEWKISRYFSVILCGITRNSTARPPQRRTRSFCADFPDISGPATCVSWKILQRSS